MKPVPDGFTGAVMAVEGIDDAAVLLHGQNGCRKGLLISQRINPRSDRVVDTDSPVYAGFRTVPYSGIVGTDYTGGSGPKLKRALEYVSQEGHGLVAVVCSPGVSIIGDDCRRAVADCGLSERAMVLDGDGFGDGCWEGFDLALVSVLRHLDPGQRNVRKGSVVVVGLSIMHKDWHSVREEVEGILVGMSLETVCFLGAGCTVDQVRTSFDAEFCLVLDPDYGGNTSEFYAAHGLKVISTGKAYAGFDDVVSLLREMSSVTGRDVKHAISMVNSARRRAYDLVSISGKDLAGTGFAIESSPVLASSLGKWLESSFAMSRSDDPDYLFCDGMSAVMNMHSGRKARCIDIGFPSPKLDFVPSPVLGIRGAMYVLDSLFNL